MKDVKFTARVLSVDASHFDGVVKVELRPDSSEAAFNAFAQNADEYEITVRPIVHFRPGYFRIKKEKAPTIAHPVARWRDEPPWSLYDSSDPLSHEAAWERVEIEPVSADRIARGDY